MDITGYDDVAVDIDKLTHVATLEIRRGPNNYFDIGTLGRVADCLTELAEGVTRAVVLCSEGKHFCAGADFSGSAEQLIGDGGPHLYDVAIRLFEQPLPIVAAVQGAAIGGGLGLALAADFRVASPESRFSANFAQLGFHQGFGLTVTLPLVVGHQAAIDLMYTGRRIGGEEAMRIGLCDDLVPALDLRQRATLRAIDIAKSAPLAVRSIRSTMRGVLVAQIREAMAHERREQERLQSTKDFIEGIIATTERRPPSFLGE